jgi:choline dehydrogenase-like flavoprotein
VKTNFDYIVVGAGSAGSVLAARLAEDADVTVALIEAGDSDNALEIDVPLLFPQLFKTQFDWDFTSEPEPALKQRRIYLPRGKVLGGSSSTNAMVYIRGHPKDFDDWASQGGPVGLLRSFCRISSSRKQMNPGAAISMGRAARSMSVIAARCILWLIASFRPRWNKAISAMTISMDIASSA